MRLERGRIMAEITGTNSSDTLTGTADADMIDGLGGDDLVRGGGGNDTLDGGVGDDVLEGGDGNDRLEDGSGSDTMRGGAGADPFVIIRGDNGANEAITIDGGDGDDRVDFYTNFRRGTLPADLGAGDDRIRPGTLQDGMRLTLGTGRDLIDLSGLNTNLRPIENRLVVTDFATGAGGDTVELSTTFRLGREVEALELTGAGRIDATGNELDNALTGNDAANRLSGALGDDVLTGGAGNDNLIGGAGADRMIGGTGDDDYSVNDTRDVVVELAGEGIDTVRTGVDLVLAEHVEDLVMGGGARVGTGNGSGNRIIGSGGSDTIAGLGGNDVLIGGIGNDVITGGDRADQLIGGAGFDVMTGGAGADLFRFGEGDLLLSRSFADRITDFSRAEGDRVRLIEVDADRTAEGDQAFRWIGAGAFTGRAGELRFDAAQGNTFIHGDTDGDGLADFFVRLDGVVSLVMADIVL